MTQPLLTGRFNDAATASRYLLAGHATITLRSQKTTDRFTYRVRKSEDGKVHFVDVLDGPDNENSYRYLGILGRYGYAHGKKSKVAETATSVVAIKWAWAHVSKGSIPTQLEIWHEGICGRCGRKLTVPESVAAGLGPECIKKS